MSHNLPKVCTCTGSGKPVEIDGVSYIFRDPACRVHQRVIDTGYQPVSAESIMGNSPYRSYLDVEEKE